MALHILKPITRVRKGGPQGGAAGLTMRAAAQQLGVSVKLLRAAIVAGEVRTIMFGGRTFIRHGEIERIRQLLAGERD
jgi:hypothetical protein